MRLSGAVACASGLALGAMDVHAGEPAPASVEAVHFAHDRLADNALPVRSARDARRRGLVIEGDPYGTTVLGENDSTALFLDDPPNDFIFDGVVENAGVHRFTEVGTSVTESFVKTSPSTGLFQVNALTDDGSDWLPSGIRVDPGAPEASLLRMDVGILGVSGVLDGEEIIDDPRIGEVITAAFGLFDDKGDLFLFPMALDVSDEGFLAGVGAVDGVQGLGINELVMIWEVQLIPAPSTGFGVGCAIVAAGRRRRRRR